jgi:dTDP-4-dehydrorhamnose reductase
MKVLITGGTGLLGKYLIQRIPPATEIAAIYIGDYFVKDHYKIRYFKIDVRENDSQTELFDSFRPDVVIHTAAVGSPDYAEKNRELTWDINVEGTRKLIVNSEKIKSTFVYISSNGIYDGDNAPYCENSDAIPANYYGEIKLKAEAVVRKSNLKSAIVRPILMYGWNHAFERQNIVTQSLAKLRQREKAFVYNDVYCNPLYADNCAIAIWKIISEDKYDTYNIGGAERVSIFELIKKVADIFHRDKNLVHPVQQGYFNELVKRPKDTTFATDKMVQNLNHKPLSLSEGLILMKRSEAMG